MPHLGQKRKLRPCGAMSALPRILLQKSLWGDERKFLEPLTRLTRGDVRGPYRFTQNRSLTSVVPAANQTRGMVETSLEAVALCGASLLSDAFAPVPSPSERGFLNSSPQAEPSVQISRTGLPR
jgi:hypothetical protein